MTERKRETAHENVRKITGNTRKNLREKAATLLIRKGNVNTPFTQKIQAKFWSLKTKGQTKIEGERKLINTSRISPISHHTSPKSYLVRRQQAVHSGQLSLQLENLTVQAANCRENCVLLFSILQKNVIAPQIQHIGLQMLDAGLKVHLSVLQPRLLEQGLLVLQVPTLPVPPVTN